MTAVSHQQILALAQGRREVEPFDTAPRTAPFLSFASNDDRRSVKLAQHARSDNADDSHVPEQLAFDDDVVGLRVEFCAHGANRFLGDAALDLLAFAVARVQIARQRLRFRQVLREQ